MAKFCEYCGAPLQEGAKFCTGCGHPVAVKSQPSQQRQQSQQPRQGQSGGQTSQFQSRQPYEPQPNNQSKFKPSPQAAKVKGNGNKKKGGCVKTLFIVALIVVLGYGGWEYYQNRDAKRTREKLTKDYPEKMKELERGQQKTGGALSGDFEFDDGDNSFNDKYGHLFENDYVYSHQDDGPKIVLNGEGYKLELPESASDVECVLVSDARMSELNQQGFNLITKPLHVTRNGNNHVYLDRFATVSIDIPEDFPKDKYNELVGVLITDDGPEYKIPDYFALREGVVKFSTGHFSDVCVDWNKEKLREAYINFVTINEWDNNLNNKKLDPTWRQQLTKFADEHYGKEINVAGKAVRELLSNSKTAKTYITIGDDVIKIGNDIVNAHDMENASAEERLIVATESIQKIAKEKMLAYLFSKLKEDETKKKKVIDEMKSDPKGETRYKTELIKIESRRNKIIGTLEDNLSVDNVEKISEKLGEGPTVEQCFMFACKTAKEKAVDFLKMKTVQMVPYVAVVQTAYKVMALTKDYIVSEELACMYKKYKKYADGNHGRVDDDEWLILFPYESSPLTTYGMTEEELRENFEKAYQDSVEINRRKVELGKLIDLIDAESTILDEFTDLKSIQKLDYASRMTRTINLMDRFREELIEVADVRRPAGTTEDSFLVSIVQEYFRYYPDQEKFYRWLTYKGYYHNVLEKDFAAMDAALWKEEPDPEIHIQIQETLGEESGKSKYWGKTLAFGTNGKPYKDWHVVVEGDDDLEYTGWSVDFPLEDAEPVTLSQYKLAMEMPNQVLVYDKESDFKKGKKPILVKEFVVDTTGGLTEVELSEQVNDEYGDYVGTFQIGFWSNAATNLKSNVKFMKNGDFSIASSGKYEGLDGNDIPYTQETSVVVNGRIDKKTGKGTFTMKGTITMKKSDGDNSTDTAEFSGEVTSNREYFNHCTSRFKENKKDQAYLYIDIDEFNGNSNSNKADYVLIMSGVHYFVSDGNEYWDPVTLKLFRAGTRFL